MTAIADLVNELEAKRAAQLVRIADLKARLADAETERMRVTDILGSDNDGYGLPFAPLGAAIVGVIAANASMFGAFIVWLTRWRETPWTGLFVFALLVSLLTLKASGATNGAGGLARKGMRRVTMLLLIGASLTAFAGLIR